MEARKFDAFNLDANESVFFKRELEYVKAKTYDVKYAPNKALGLFPVSTEPGPAATEITYRSYDKVGMAKMIADYATDFPRVDVYGTESTIKVHALGDSYGYSIEEIRRAQRAGLSLESKRATVAREAIDNKLNTIAMSGESANNIKGFLNYSGITEVTVTSGSAGDTWDKKTADEILADMNAAVEAVLTTTNGIEAPDTMLLPLTRYLLIGRKRIGTDSDGKTVMTYFLENNPYIKRIEWLTELETSGDSSSKQMYVFKNDADHIEFFIPLPFESFEADKKGMTYEVPCMAKTAGIVIYYPLSCAFMSGI